MDQNFHTSLSKIWEYTEQHELDQESEFMHDTRKNSVLVQEGQLTASASECEFIAQEARILNAHSVIVIGTSCLMEVLHLAYSLPSSALVTIVNPSSQTNQAIRRFYSSVQADISVKLRMVNANINEYLPRLNENDYDMIVLKDGITDVQKAISMSARLLKSRGALVISDVMALQTPGSKGGVVNPADRSEKAVDMRALITQLPDDDSFNSVLLPIGSGVFLSVRK